MILRVTGDSVSAAERDLFVRTAHTALTQGSQQFVGWVRMQIFSTNMNKAQDKDHFSKVYRKVRFTAHPDKHEDPAMKHSTPTTTTKAYCAV